MFELKTKFQVYYVNPKKGWGVRPEKNIEKNTYLFEYAGILTLDKEFDEKNDYLFYFEYVCIFNLLKFFCFYNKIFS